MLFLPSVHPPLADGAWGGGTGCRRTFKWGGGLPGVPKLLPEEEEDRNQFLNQNLKDSRCHA